jgi:hypothetical protein
VVKRKRQADGVQRFAHAPPNLGGGHAKVLGPEGNVVTDTGKNHLRIRVLLHQSGPASLRGRGLSVDQQSAEFGGFFIIAENTGQGMQQR